MTKGMFVTMDATVSLAAVLVDAAIFVRTHAVTTTITGALSTLFIEFDPSAVTRLFKRSLAKVNRFFQSGS